MRHRDPRDRRRSEAPHALRDGSGARRADNAFRAEVSQPLDRRANPVPTLAIAASADGRRDAPSDLSRHAPWILVATSVVLWWALPPAWTLALSPWLTGALLSASGLYLRRVVREIGEHWPPAGARADAAGTAAASVPIRVERAGLRRLWQRCRSVRRLCVAEWVTRAAVAGGPLLALTLWLALQAQPSRVLAGVAWALCVGGLALSLAIGGLIREFLHRHGSNARGQAAVVETVRRQRDP